MIAVDGAGSEIYAGSESFVHQLTGIIVEGRCHRKQGDGDSVRQARDSADSTRDPCERGLTREGRAKPNT